VRDDTTFNESFAAAVEEAGVARWIAARAGTDAHARLAAEQARADRLRGVFVQLVRDARAELAAVYASDAPEAVKQARKAAAFASMRAAYEAARAGEAGLAGYERWFAGHDGRGPNNASLASVALYDEKAPAFRALLARYGGDLPRFYAEVRYLAKRPKAERDAILGGTMPQ
jgi:predicted aminopeptidase